MCLHLFTSVQMLWLNDFHYHTVTHSTVKICVTVLAGHGVLSWLLEPFSFSSLRHVVHFSSIFSSFQKKNIWYRLCYISWNFFGLVVLITSLYVWSERRFNSNVNNLVRLSKLTNSISTNDKNVTKTNYNRLHFILKTQRNIYALIPALLVATQCIALLLQFGYAGWSFLMCVGLSERVKTAFKDLCLYFAYVNPCKWKRVAKRCREPILL